MTNFPPEVEQNLAELTELLKTEQPEMYEILTQASTANEAVLGMFKLITAKPELLEQLDRLTMLSFNPLVPTTSGVGYRLDPLYEASLQERLAFDGDAPELRFGAIPENTTPAVPVDTEATNPVAVGWMLGDASEKVLAEVRQIEASHAEGLVVSQTTDLAPYDRNSLPDPVGYERGKEPAFVSVESPGWGLLSLPEAQKKELAWKALSTTQGRKSFVRAIADQIGGALRKQGWIVFIGGSEHPSGEEIAYAQWVTGISGPESTQPLFSFADVAWRALCSSLLEQLQNLPEESVIGVVVSPVNTISDRRVGFEAKVYKQ